MTEVTTAQIRVIEGGIAQILPPKVIIGQIAVIVT
jgi:hypothetical protein